MKHYILIEKRADCDELEIYTAWSMKEAAEICLAGDINADYIQELELPENDIEHKPAAKFVTTEVINMALDIWRANCGLWLAYHCGGGPEFLLKHREDDVEEMVEANIAGEIEDKEHIRLESMGF